MGLIQLGDGQDWNCGCAVSPLKKWRGIIWDMTAGLALGAEVEKGRGGPDSRKKIGKGRWGLRGLLSSHFFSLYPSPFFTSFSFSYHSFTLCRLTAKGAFHSALCAATHGGGVVIRYTGHGLRGREYCQCFLSCREKLASWRYPGSALGAVHESSWE